MILKLIADYTMLAVTIAILVFLIRFSRNRAKARNSAPGFAVLFTQAPSQDVCVEGFFADADKARAEIRRIICDSNNVLTYESLPDSARSGFSEDGLSWIGTWQVDDNDVAIRFWVVQVIPVA